MIREFFDQIIRDLNVGPHSVGSIRTHFDAYGNAYSTCEYLCERDPEPDTMERVQSRYSGNVQIEHFWNIYDGNKVSITMSMSNHTLKDMVQKYRSQ